MDLATSLARALPRLRVSADPPDRVAYARDLWPRRLLDVRAGRPAEHRPALVVWPTSVEEVSALVRFAQAEGVPLVPFGAGSGVCGGVEPEPRSIVVDLKRMRDYRIDADAPLIDVGPGAMGITLEEEIQRRGYTIGHFPSSILCSTVGGWVAARGAGQCSGLYGKIEDMVVSLECVLGDGEVVELRRRRSGPDLVPLMIGSEGTLGVITRAKLRLHPVPRARAYSAYSFKDIAAGWDAMRQLFQSGLRPAVSRLYDPIDSVLMRQGSVKPERGGSPRRRSGSGRSRALAGVLRSALRVPAALNTAIEALEGNLLGGSTLVLVFEGVDAEVHADSERAEEICRRLGAVTLGEGPARTWFSHRYSVSYRQSPVFRMGAFSDTMEVAAPWSRLDQLYDDVRRALGQHVLVMAHLSHAYPDGCSIYFTFSGVGQDDADAARIYESAWRDALGAAIAAGGTLSHHHGVGRSKAPRLGEELGLGVDVIRRLMHACDPSGIMNPGNLTPREPFDSSTSPGARRGTSPWVAGEEEGAPADIDETSLLASFAGGTQLSVAESLLAARGMTLGLECEAGRDDVASWVAQGMPGGRDPWSDPVDHLVAGLTAQLRSGEELVIQPAPRRAVGPDLVQLFAGAGERIGRVERATLRVRRSGAPTARRLPFNIDRDPPLSGAERALWERLAGAVVG